MEPRSKTTYTYPHQNLNLLELDRVIIELQLSVEIWENVKQMGIRCATSASTSMSDDVEWKYYKCGVN